MNQVADLKAYKEKSIIDLESYRDQLDKMIKSITFQIEVNERNVKEYSNKVYRQCEELFKSDLAGCVQKINDVSIENGKYHLEAMKKTKELVSQIEEMKNVENEFKQTFEVELDKLKKFQGIQYENVLKDVYTMQSSVKTFTDKINVIYL